MTMTRNELALSESPAISKYSSNAVGMQPQSIVLAFPTVSHVADKVPHSHVSS